MKCNNCNAELLEGTMFCPYCGTKCVADTEPVVKNAEVINNESKQEKPTEPSCWATFARISNILGIVTISTFWIPIFGGLSIIPGVPGIVFGALGKSSMKEEVRSVSSSGFVKSLVGTIFSAVLYFIWAFIVQCAQ